jgi:hypothetical protein
VNAQPYAEACEYPAPVYTERHAWWAWRLHRDTSYVWWKMGPIVLQCFKMEARYWDTHQGWWAPWQWRLNWYRRPSDRKR